MRIHHNHVGWRAALQDGLDETVRLVIFQDIADARQKNKQLLARLVRGFIFAHIEWRAGWQKRDGSRKMQRDGADQVAPKSPQQVKLSAVPPLHSIHRTRYSPACRVRKSSNRSSPAGAGSGWRALILRRNSEW